MSGGGVFAEKSDAKDSYAVDVEFNRQMDGGYACEAVVTSAADGSVVVAPHVVALLGKPAVAISDSGNRRARLEVQLDPGTNRASVSLQIMEAGTVIASQRVTVVIR